VLVYVYTTAVTCTGVLPPILGHGRYDNHKCQDPALFREYGDQCNVICNQGYFLVKKIVYTCLDFGNWSNGNKKSQCTCKYNFPFFRIPNKAT